MTEENDAMAKALRVEAELHKAAAVGSEKWRYYMVGLTFAIIGASIQTTNLAARPSIAAWAEGFALLMLFLAAVGMLYKQMTGLGMARDAAKAVRNLLRAAERKAMGKKLTAAEESHVAALHRGMAQERSNISKKGECPEFGWLWWSFVFGLLILLIVRFSAGLAPVDHSKGPKDSEIHAAAELVVEENKGVKAE